VCVCICVCGMCICCVCVWCVCVCVCGCVCVFGVCVWLCMCVWCVRGVCVCVRARGFMRACLCVHVHVFMSGGWVGGGGGDYSKISLGTKIFLFKLLITCNACVYGSTSERLLKVVQL